MFHYFVTWHQLQNIDSFPLLYNWRSKINLQRVSIFIALLIIDKRLRSSVISSDIQFAVCVIQMFIAGSPPVTPIISWGGECMHWHLSDRLLSLCLIYALYTCYSKNCFQNILCHVPLHLELLVFWSLYIVRYFENTDPLIARNSDKSQTLRKTHRQTENKVLS